MNDSWEDPTESILGAFDERSLEIDVDFASLPPSKAVEDLSTQAAIAELWPGNYKGAAIDPDLVVFDPMGFDLPRHLAALGYRLRVAATGVDVMTLVAARPTGAVVCGPAEDAERRRLLTAALRLRFPAVPVVYVSTHGRNPQAVQGAKAEGAQVVLPLPLPPVADLHQVLSTMSRPAAEPQPALEPGPVADAEDAPDEDEDPLSTQPLDLAAVWNAPDAPARPAPAPAPALDEAAGFEDEPPTEVMGMASAPAGGTPPTAEEDIHLHVDDEVSGFKIPSPTLLDERGEVGELLSAISPFLWGLEDAARWADTLAAQGDAEGATHARTLQLLAKLLKQLQDRAADRGL